MSLFDVNFSQFSTDILPPDKRLPGNTSLLQSMLGALQWCRDLVLGSYKTGAIAPKYSPGIYNQFDQVIYNKAVYESLIANNTDIPTTSNWRVIQSNFIGVDERIKFNSAVCVLEYALNKRFGGNFRMPPAASHSDIYISNVPPVPFGFRVGNSKGSTVGNSNSSDTIGSISTFRQVTGYQVNFLTSLFAFTSQQEVRDFVNLYNATGITFIIVTY